MTTQNTPTIEEYFKEDQFKPFLKNVFSAKTFVRECIHRGFYSALNFHTNKILADNGNSEQETDTILEQQGPFVDMNGKFVNYAQYLAFPSQRTLKHFIKKSDQRTGYDLYTNVFSEQGERFIKMKSKTSIRVIELNTMTDETSLYIHFQSIITPETHEMFTSHTNRSAIDPKFYYQDTGNRIKIQADATFKEFEKNFVKRCSNKIQKTGLFKRFNLEGKITTFFFDGHIALSLIKQGTTLDIINDNNSTLDFSYNGCCKVNYSYDANGDYNHATATVVLNTFSIVDSSLQERLKVDLPEHKTDLVQSIIYNCHNRLRKLIDTTLVNIIKNDKDKDDVPDDTHATIFTGGCNAIVFDKFVDTDINLFPTNLGDMADNLKIPRQSIQCLPLIYQPLVYKTDSGEETYARHFSLQNIPITTSICSLGYLVYQEIMSRIFTNAGSLLSVTKKPTSSLVSARPKFYEDSLTHFPDLDRPFYRKHNVTIKSISNPYYSKYTESKYTVAENFTKYDNSKINVIYYGNTLMVPQYSHADKLLLDLTLGFGSDMYHDNMFAFLTKKAGKDYVPDFLRFSTQRFLLKNLNSPSFLFIFRHNRLTEFGEKQLAHSDNSIMYKKTLEDDYHKHEHVLQFIKTKIEKFVSIDYYQNMINTNIISFILNGMNTKVFINLSYTEENPPQLDNQQGKNALVRQIVSSAHNDKHETEVAVENSYSDTDDEDDDMTYSEDLIHSMALMDNNDDESSDGDINDTILSYHDSTDSDTDMESNSHDENSDSDESESESYEISDKDNVLAQNSDYIFERLKLFNDAHNYIYGSNMQEYDEFETYMDNYNTDTENTMSCARRPKPLPKPKPAAAKKKPATQKPKPAKSKAVKKPVPGGKKNTTPKASPKKSSTPAGKTKPKTESKTDKPKKQKKVSETSTKVSGKNTSPTSKPTTKTPVKKASPKPETTTTANKKNPTKKKQTPALVQKNVPKKSPSTKTKPKSTAKPATSKSEPKPPKKADVKTKVKDSSKNKKPKTTTQSPAEQSAKPATSKVKAKQNVFAPSVSKTTIKDKSKTINVSFGKGSSTGGGSSTKNFMPSMPSTSTSGMSNRTGLFSGFASSQMPTTQSKTLEEEASDLLNTKSSSQLKPEVTSTELVSNDNTFDGDDAWDAWANKINVHNKKS